jgi:outer membrane protein OmpA-like peptidoglycan-associated protein
MAIQDNRRNGEPPGNPPPQPAMTTKGWLPWLLLALGVLAILFGLNRCSDNDELARNATAPAVTPGAPATPDASATPVVSAVAVLPGISGVGSFLAGTEAVPRTFVFERLNFATDKSEILPADRDEVDTLAAVLKQYPNARIRIVGYADARGTVPYNATLGKERADSVKAALVAAGIDAARLETASGGETDPVATNATAEGRAENRRTELIVLQR